MVRTSRQKPRNLNGLHPDIAAPHQSARLPPPTTSLQDMQHLLDGRSVRSLLESKLERCVLL